MIPFGFASTQMCTETSHSGAAYFPTQTFLSPEKQSRNRVTFNATRYRRSPVKGKRGKMKHDNRSYF